MTGPATPATTHRWVRLDGPLNFRDLGGYATTDGMVRTGVLYRSDGLDTLSPADLDRLRHRLGIRRIVDLRSTAELDVTVIGRFGRTGIEHHHVPIIDQTGSIVSESSVRMADLYRRMLTEGGDRFVAGLGLIADSDGPTVFHCMAGKDRTGLLAALLLSLLGVSDEDVSADYALSETVMDGLRARFVERMRQRQLAGEDDLPRIDDRPDVSEEMFSARPATIAGVLAELRGSHGGVDRWLLAQGLPAETIERLRTNLVV